jgi:ATP-binding cassette subfamily F protein uup
MGAPNVLLFDEPTNDLDIQTLSILEDYLDGFPGAVIVISHDRYFLDRVVQRIFCLEGNGTIGHYPGGYTDYQEIQQYEENQRQEVFNGILKTEKQSGPQGNARLKFSYNEQREFATIDDDIAALEQNLAAIDVEMSKEASNYDLLQELLMKKQTIEEELSAKMDRWVYLNDLAVKISQLS